MYKFERIEAAMKTVEYHAKDYIKSTCLSALDHSINSNGEITHTTMNKLYDYLADDYDILPGGAETRIRTLRKCMMSTMDEDLRCKIFGPEYKDASEITNYNFIFLLAKYVVSIW